MLNSENGTPVLPEILAPAGDMPAALAAFAAGADAVYLGLKHFSARMQAENFALSDLARLTDFAHSEGKRVYVAMNTLLKPGDVDAAFRLIRRLELDVHPDALILQDTGTAKLAKAAEFSGELHFSTLANVTHPKALDAVKALGGCRAILPRELSVDEVRQMDAACPPGMDLEIFVHGALCWCVSGRCWWSGFMGGKSGLRGRCVQPCRRVYTQKGKEGRFFSCMDLSLDALARLLLELPRIRSWKIEGRKKGPHYVYYAVTAYRMLRDEGHDAAARKEAQGILDMALGRPGTRSRFLPQKMFLPTTTADKDGVTGSGFLAGKTGKGTGSKVEFRPRLDLLPKDYLRVGYEDEAWHCTVSIPKWVPKGAAFTLSLPRGKFPKPGTPVFLIDRKEPELLSLLADRTRVLMARPEPVKSSEDVASRAAPSFGRPVKPEARSLDIRLRSSLPSGRDGKADVKGGAMQGLWLSPGALNAVSSTLFGRISWWLPPVIWPDEEEVWERHIHKALRDGARRFVCNEPWQVALFPNKEGLDLTAGPMCNMANAAALAAAAELGFNAAVAAPELGGEDFLALPAQSPLPLGIVLTGFWPMGISRHAPAPLQDKDAFVSPKGEGFWYKRYGQNTWVYPDRPLDLSAHRSALERAGYRIFIHMDEHPPRGVETPRTGEYNWDVGLL